MPSPDNAVEIGPALSEILRIPTPGTTRTAGEALAAASGLAAPRLPETQFALAAIVVALQRYVIDEPRMPLDRAYAVHRTLLMAADRSGSERLRVTFEELGEDAIDVGVRRALYERVLPALMERGVIQLVGA